MSSTTTLAIIGMIVSSVFGTGALVFYVNYSTRLKLVEVSARNLQTELDKIIVAINMLPTIQLKLDTIADIQKDMKVDIRGIVAAVGASSSAAAAAANAAAAAASAAAETRRKANEQ
jgi:hypothetical protein